MKIIKGWKMLSHECGYLNDVIRANCWLFQKKNSATTIMFGFLSLGKSRKDEGKTISPDYATKSKADAFAENWMLKHPNGTV